MYLTVVKVLFFGSCLVFSEVKDFLICFEE